MHKRMPSETLLHYTFTWLKHAAETFQRPNFSKNGLHTLVCSLANCFSSRLVCLYTLVLYRNWTRDRKREGTWRVNRTQRAFVLNSHSFWPRSTKWGLQIYCAEKLYLVCCTNLLSTHWRQELCRKCSGFTAVWRHFEPPLGHNMAWKGGDCTDWIGD